VAQPYLIALRAARSLHNAEQHRSQLAKEWNRQCHRLHMRLPSHPETEC